MLLYLFPIIFSVTFILLAASFLTVVTLFLLDIASVLLESPTKQLLLKKKSHPVVLCCSFLFCQKKNLLHRFSLVSKFGKIIRTLNSNNEAAFSFLRFTKVHVLWKRAHIFRTFEKHNWLGLSSILLVDCLRLVTYVLIITCPMPQSSPVGCCLLVKVKYIDWQVHPVQLHLSSCCVVGTASAQRYHSDWLLTLQDPSFIYFYLSLFSDINKTMQIENSISFCAP